MRYKKANGVEYYISDNGYVVMKNPKTIRTYRRLSEGGNDDWLDKQLKSVGVFWAFSDDQFNEGVAKLKERGLYSEGEKIVSLGAGGYVTKALFPKLQEILKEHKMKMKDCNPQEVYFYEYNNRECMLDWDGDESAFEIVREIFGDEVAKTIKRI